MMSVPNARWSARSWRTLYGNKSCAVRKHRVGRLNALNEEDSDVLNFRNKLRSQYLKDKLDDAVAGMKKACDKEPTSKDCAIAWEEVEELQLAAEKKFKPVEAENFANQSKSEKYDILEGTDIGRLIISLGTRTHFFPQNSEVESDLDKTQETLQKKNLLSDVQPCDIIECDEPGGTLLAAGKLEQSLNDKAKSKKRDKRTSELKQDLQMAISDAFDACGDGTKDDCTAAWEKVDELSFELDKEEEM